MQRGKKPKITLRNRDIALLIALAVRLLTFKEIRNSYFREGGRLLSKAVVSRRLTKLFDSNFVRKTIFKGIICYCLGVKGIRYLVEEKGINIKDIKIVHAKSYVKIRQKIKSGFIAIQKRDKQILIFAANGSASNKQMRRFFVDKNGKQLSRAACDIRINKLCTHGFLTKFRYPSSPSIMFCLGPAGVSYLRNDMNYSGIIRSKTTWRENVAHELVVTETVRAIMRDEEERIFRVLDIYDENSLREAIPLKKGSARPDLYLRLKKPNGAERIFFIEIETGKMPRKKLVKRLLKYNKNILVITLNSRDRDALQNAIMKYGDQNLIKRTALAVSGDISKEGFAKCRGWKFADNVPANII